MKIAVMVMLAFLAADAKAQSTITDENINGKDIVQELMAEEGDTAKAKAVDSMIGYLKNAMHFNMFSPQEKVYMHFDNTGYFKGEYIRFKAYVIRCDTRKRTDLSHILYVELINPSGDVVEKRKLKIENGEADGDIKVDSIQTTGFYEIRAYTRYMANWGTHACFSRVFPIFKAPTQEGNYTKMELDQFSYRKRLPNSRVDDEGVIKETYTTALTVNFYPEGGDLVEGLQSRVAMTISSEDGTRQQLTGRIEDEKKAKVCDIKTDTLGRALFNFTPQPGKQYFAVVTNSKDKEKRFPLPEAKKDGVVMNLDMLGEIDLKATLRSTLGMQGKMLGYALMYNGTVIECDTMTASDKIELTFNRFVLPEGVNQLTVFDSQGQIQAERLFFIYPTPREQDSITISSNIGRLNPCQLVTMKLQSEPNTSISFSAMDAATMTNGWEGNMKTWMLLSSEVKGYIENPEYYFEADDDAHRQAADLLMMIQGWRRYDFRLLAGLTELENRQPIEDKLYLFGQVKSKRKKYSNDDVEISAYMYNRKGEVIDGKLKTDSLGKYTYIVPDVEGNWSLQMISKKDDKEQNYYIGIDRHFSPAKRYLYPYETKILPMREPNFRPGLNLTNVEEEEEEEHISITKRNHLLPTVKVKARRRILGDLRVIWFDEEGAQKHSVLRYDCDEDADKAADLGEDVPPFYEWLAERNSFFEFDRGPATNETTKEGVYMSDALTGYNHRPIIWMIDNTIYGITNIPKSLQDRITIYSTNNQTEIVQLPDFIDEVNTVYISEDVSSIKRYFLADDLEGLNAVVIFIYRHPKFYFKEKGLRRTHFEGFNVPTAFEMEDYSIMPPMEDYRRTIYWNANVMTDNRGRATVEFYNNSSCKEMFISAEGMTEEGKIVINQ